MRYSILCGTLMVLPVAVWGQESVRYYEQNGATIREARTTVNVPVNDVRVEEQTQTYYQPRTTSQVAQVALPTQRPVTQYRWVPKWHGWWNIIRGPHLAYHLESDRRLVTTWQTASVPVMQTTMVPETRTTRVTVPYVRYEPREQVARTVMLPSQTNTTLAVAAPATDPRLAAANFAVHPRYTPLTAARPVAVAAAMPAAPSAPMLTYAAATPMPTYLPPQSYTVYDPSGRPYLAASPAGDSFGGVARLDGDLPRYSTNNPYGVWQARRQPGAANVSR